MFAKYPLFSFLCEREACTPFPSTASRRSRYSSNQPFAPGETAPGDGTAGNGNRQQMSLSRRTKWIAALVLFAAAATLFAFFWRPILTSLIYERPLRYDVPFSPAVAGADRIVVRADGFDCCGPVD